MRRLILDRLDEDVLTIKPKDLVKLKLSDAVHVDKKLGAIADASNGHLVLGTALIGYTEGVTNALLLYNDYNYEIVTMKAGNVDSNYLIITKK